MPKKKFKLPYADAAPVYQLAGNAREAWVLLRLVSWYRYAQVEEEGYLWVVKTQEEWAEDTGMELHQVRRAFRRLREMKLVAVVQRRWGTRWVNYTRPTAKTITKVWPKGVQ